jgi:hypothetical protein
MQFLQYITPHYSRLREHEAEHCPKLMNAGLRRYRYRSIANSQRSPILARIDRSRGAANLAKATRACGKAWVPEEDRSAVLEEVGIPTVVGVQKGNDGRPGYFPPDVPRESRTFIALPYRTDARICPLGNDICAAVLASVIDYD